MTFYMYVVTIQPTTPPPPPHLLSHNMSLFDAMLSRIHFVC